MFIKFSRCKNPSLNVGTRISGWEGNKYRCRQMKWMYWGKERMVQCSQVGVTEQRGLTGYWSCFLTSPLGQCIGTLLASAPLSEIRWAMWTTQDCHMSKSSQEFPPIDILGGRQSPGTSTDHRFSFVSDDVLSYLFPLTSDYQRTKEIYRTIFCIRIGISKSFFFRSSTKVFLQCQHCFFNPSGFSVYSLKWYTWILNSVFFSSAPYSLLFNYATL